MRIRKSAYNSEPLPLSTPWRSRWSCSRQPPPAAPGARARATASCGPGALGCGCEGGGRGGRMIERLGEIERYERYEGWGGREEGREGG